MSSNGQESLLSRHNEALLRAALLCAAREEATLQDRIDCAELALAAGNDALARLLYDVAFLHLGFGANELAAQAAIVRSTGLWSDAAFAHSLGDQARATSTIELAMSDLQALQEAERPSDFFEPSDVWADAGFSRESSENPMFPDLVHALVEALRCGEAESLRRLPSLVPKLQVELADIDPAAPLSAVGADIPILGELFARADLRRLFQGLEEVALPPSGSPRLLHAMARLSRYGLGPWFGNIGNIIRDARDLLPLIVKLSPGQDWTSGPRLLWLCCLASRLTESRFLELADELADRAEDTALQSLFTASRNSRHLSRSYGCAQRFRDIALDLGFWPLAVAAQKEIVSIAARDPSELRVLADIQATSGDLDEARSTLRGYALLNHEYPAITARLRAIEAGDYSPFLVNGGLCHDPYRRSLRRAARDRIVSDKRGTKAT